MQGVRRPQTRGLDRPSRPAHPRVASRVRRMSAATAQRSRARRRESWPQRLRRRWFAYFFGLVVPVGVYGVFVGYPLLYSIYLAFVKWDLFAPHKQWVGLANFRELFQDSLSWRAFGNTVKWTIGTLFVVDVLAPLIAIFLNSKRVYFPTFFRTVFFIPVTMSLVAVGLMFSFYRQPGVRRLQRALRLHRHRRSERRSARQSELGAVHADRDLRVVVHRHRDHPLPRGDPSDPRGTVRGRAPRRGERPPDVAPHHAADAAPDLHGRDHALGARGAARIRPDLRHDARRAGQCEPGARVPDVSLGVQRAARRLRRGDQHRDARAERGVRDRLPPAGGRSALDGEA